MYNVKYMKRKIYVKYEERKTQNIIKVSANVPTEASQSNRTRYITCRHMDSE